METDPTAFYTYEEYTAAVEMLYRVVTLRGQSISGQLDGTIPSIASEQRYSDALVDASPLDLGVMGRMKMGGGFNFDGPSPNWPSPSDVGAEGDNKVTGTPKSDAEAAVLLFSESREGDESATDSAQPSRMMPGSFDPSAMDLGYIGSPFTLTRNLTTYGICFAVLIIALLFAKQYRRKP